MTPAKAGGLALRWKLLLAVVAPIVVLGGLEGLVRLFGITPRRHDAPLVFVGAEFRGRFPNEWDDDVFWKLEPGRDLPWGAELGGPERVNSQGCRGPDFTAEKPGGVRRVLCLGDSNTFGLGVAEHATFAHRLRRWLETGATGRFEVINAGVPGYSLWQMAGTFRVKGAAFDPDIVILYPGAWNEFTPAIGGSDVALSEQVERSREGLGRLRLVQLLRSVVRKRDDAAEQQTRKRYNEAFWGEGRCLDGPRVPPGDFKRLLLEFADAVQARGARLVLVVPPAPAKTRKTSPDGEQYANLVRETARERGIALVDLREVMGGLDRDEHDLFVDIIHPSVEGHRLIFDALASTLAGLGLAPPLPPLPEQLEPINLAVERARLACPGILRFDEIRVPPQASVILDLGIDTSKGGRPEGATFRVLIECPGTEPKPILTSRYAAGLTPIHADLCRADLASFAGQTISLVLEITGSADSAFVENAAIHPFR